ncbi:hypothetical protein RCL_jg22678.t1 [Rhizophagus clarus]|uniref:Uncharacterized protein n=1 Tax=Rhizophagus clarus TaxID=94130 RepID=A0A8H3QX41_9GLOM|nr:hypothetical protein RCL_jg22678.t1 [Rhizophagus clarus]
MASSLSVDSNPQVQKDGKILKEINLVDEEKKIYIEMPQDCKDLEKNVKNALYKAMNYYWNVPNEYAMISALLRSIYKNYPDEEDDESDDQYNNSLLASIFMQNTKELDKIIRK